MKRAGITDLIEDQREGRKSPNFVVQPKRQGETPCAYPQILPVSVKLVNSDFTKNTIDLNGNVKYMPDNGKETT